MKKEKKSMDATPSERNEEKNKRPEQLKASIKTKKPKKQRKPLSENSAVHIVMPVLLLALCAFLGICIYTEVSAGVFGNWCGRIFFGLFGGAAYLIPVLCLFAAASWRKAVKAHTLTKKALLGAASFLLIAILFYTFGVPDAKKESIDLFWQLGKKSVGGGVLGNLLGFPFYYFIGKVGTSIFAITFLVFSLVLLFEVNFKKLGNLFVACMLKMRQHLAGAKERRAVARAENERLKREKKEQQKEEFYEKQAVRMPQKADNSKAIRSSAQSPFLLGGEKSDKKPVTRQFYDADADDLSAPAENNEKAADTLKVRSARFEDEDFFSKVPESPYTVSSYGKPAKEEADESDIDTVEGEDGALTRIEIVSNRPIPEKPKNAAPIVSVDVPIEDEEGDDEDLEDVAHLAAPKKTAKKSKEDEALVINEAHTIEHVGVDTFVDEAEEYYKKEADNFFYSFPPLSLLHEDDAVNRGETDEVINDKAKKLMDTLDSFGVEARISCVSRGPRLTRYELVPKPGVKIRSIENLVNEIAMNLEAVSVRIEAPIPGKAALGIEVPNTKYSTVRLRGLLDTDTFRDSPGKTTVCLGVDVVGTPVFADLDKMPHLLVAGATGMGKSVCINSILVSLLYKARPDEVKLILIDPKKVEFKSYYNIPHLLVPVVTEAQKAAGSLSWAVNEMERRYDIIERVGVRNIKAYNATLADHPEREKLTQIVIVIDELHDLMLQAREAVEDSIARIAAKARAAGILLIIGTQRPSVNVITGVIKANIPSRIAFHVASQVDSRTILDTVGAEKLLNNGDMLFLSPGMQMMSPKRVQGAFLDDDEVLRVAEYLRNNSSGVKYDESIMADMDRESEKYNKEKKAATDLPMSEGGDGANEDDLLYRAIEIALENSKISTSLLQRKLSIGFGKAARLIDRMEELGVVSSLNGQKPREILITMDEYRAMRLRNDE